MERRAFLASAFAASGLVCLPKSAAALQRQRARADVDPPSRTELFQLIEREANEADRREAVQFFSLYGPFRFPNDTDFDVTSGQPRRDCIFGIDVSHHNSAEFPIEIVKRKKIKFVYMKATQGTGFRDRQFQSFWRRSGSPGDGSRVHRGAYHFLSSQSSGADQAQHFLSQIQAAGGLTPTDMPPVLDIEWDVPRLNAPDRWATKTPDQIIQSAQQWLTIVGRELGRTPLVYTARAWWRERVRNEDRIAQLGAPLWIADYSRTSRASEQPPLIGGRPWLLWQFTASAQMAQGFAGRFDANIFKGSNEDFHRAFGTREFA